jgi:hypothetical protein
VLDIKIIEATLIFVVENKRGFLFGYKGTPVLLLLPEDTGSGICPPETENYIKMSICGAWHHKCVTNERLVTFSNDLHWIAANKGTSWNIFMNK